MIAAGQHIVVDLAVPVLVPPHNQAAHRAEPAEQHKLLEAVEKVIFWPEHCGSSAVVSLIKQFIKQFIEQFIKISKR